MKKSAALVPTADEIMKYDNVPPDMAARFVGWSTPTIYRALQECRAPFGFAVQNNETRTWAYNISPGLLVQYKAGNLPTYRLREVQELAAEGIERILDAKLGTMRRFTEAAS